MSISKKSVRIQYVLLLDESGSMSHLKSATIYNLQKQIEDIKKAQEELPGVEYYLTLLTFSTNVNMIYENIPPHYLTNLHLSIYDPNGSTALNDALGEIINSFKIEDENDSIIVTILTDGEENASRNWTVDKVKNIIRSLEDSNQWIFNLVGTSMDVNRYGSMYGIRKDRIMSYDYNEEGVQNAISTLSASIKSFTVDAMTIGVANASTKNFFTSNEAKI